MFTHTVGFRVTNDLTCLTFHDQQQRLLAASEPHARRMRAQAAGISSLVVLIACASCASRRGRDACPIMEYIIQLARPARWMMCLHVWEPLPVHTRSSRASPATGFLLLALLPGAMRRQQDLFLASLFVFPALPKGSFFAPDGVGEAHDEEDGRVLHDDGGDHTLHCSFTGLCHKIYMKHLRKRAEEAQGLAGPKTGGAAAVHRHLMSEHQADEARGSGEGWEERVGRLRQGALSRDTLTPPVALDTGLVFTWH